MQLIAYLARVSQLKELQDVAIYADYWRASLLARSGKLQEASQVYRGLLNEAGGAIQDSVRKRLEGLNRLIAKRRHT